MEIKRDKYLFSPNLNPSLSADDEHLRDALAASFRSDKAGHKQRSDTGFTNMTRDVALAPSRASIHAALHAYERSHLQGGRDWEALFTALQQTYGVTLVARDSGVDRKQLWRQAQGGAAVMLGTVFFQRARFTLLDPQPQGLRNPVFIRRGDSGVAGRHYVHLENSDTYVRRYVTRGLSAFDAMNMTLGRPLSPPVSGEGQLISEIDSINFPRRFPAQPVGVLPTENQQLLSHGRGWAKRYISTGVSNRPAYSTRGTPFEGLYGSVTVDLAQVPLYKVFDLHTHDLAAQHLGTRAETILEKGPSETAANLADEEYLALRDFIRTRELLIKGDLPLSALVYQPDAFTLVGIGSGTHAENRAVANLIAQWATTVQAPIQRDDCMTYRHLGTGKYWHCFEFLAPLSPVKLLTLRTMMGNTRTVTSFRRFAAVRPIGMV